MEKQYEHTAMGLRSEAMNQMLSEPPKWIVRSGSTLILCVLLLLLALTWFIRYPDQVAGDVLLRGSGMMAASTGRQEARLYAVAVIPASKAGTFRVGQKALIELKDFPKAEYGVLEGKVLGIIYPGKEGAYELNIGLPHQLKTSVNKYIPLRAELKGTVKIITSDRRLLERFFEGMRGLVD